MSSNLWSLPLPQKNSLANKVNFAEVQGVQLFDLIHASDSLLQDWALDIIYLKLCRGLGG